MNNVQKIRDLIGLSPKWMFNQTPPYKVQDSICKRVKDYLKKKTVPSRQSKSDTHRDCDIMHEFQRLDWVPNRHNHSTEKKM